VNHLYFTDWITLSDRSRGPAYDRPGCVRSPALETDRSIDRAGPTMGPDASVRRADHVVRQLMPADCLRGILMRRSADGR